MVPLAALVQPKVFTYRGWGSYTPLQNHEARRPFIHKLFIIDRLKITGKTFPEGQRKENFLHELRGQGQLLNLASSLFVPKSRLSVRPGKSSDLERFMPHLVHNDISPSRSATAHH